VNDAERANYFFRLEQQMRLQIRERTDDLRATAEHIVARRARCYPRKMRPFVEGYVESIFRDLCDEDLPRKLLIENQQHYLRLAHAYQTRAVAHA
jgi:hypothetical protein